MKRVLRFPNFIKRVVRYYLFRRWRHNIVYLNAPSYTWIDSDRRMEEAMIRILWEFVHYDIGGKDKLLEYIGYDPEGPYKSVLELYEWFHEPAGRADIHKKAKDAGLAWYNATRDMKFLIPTEDDGVKMINPKMLNVPEWEISKKLTSDEATQYTDHIERLFEIRQYLWT